MKPRLNIELFKAIREKIATTPEAYDQAVYGRPESAAPCGTAACIAGWACVLSGQMDTQELLRRERSRGWEFDSIAETAQRVLGLSEEEADTLFEGEPGGQWDDYDDEGGNVYTGGWPEPFAGDWRDARREDQIATAYLTHIIETGKVLE